MDTNNVLRSSNPRTMISSECKICHDEDQESNMEAPCSCRGSLEYAHRKCVQRWCDEKGNIICEICLQQFEPGYTARRPLFHCGGVPMNFRGDWGIISTSDLRDSRLTSTDFTDDDFTDPNFDEYPMPSSRTLICCRVVAFTFVILLFLRHTLPFVLYDDGEYSISLFMLLMLRTIGILVPAYITVKALKAIRRMRNQQVSPTIFPIASFDEENESRRHHQESHFIHLP
ncbi:hypothetical protein ABFX02_12G027300 [Erythranthe guttata]